MTVPPHRLAVLAQQAECALEVGRSYVEIPTVDLLTLLATVATPAGPVMRDGVDRPCPRCHGTGDDPVHASRCWTCGGTGEEILYLCGACGAIRPQLTYTAWKSDDEGDHWIPAEEGDGDPMLRCPACGDEHRDSDSDSGLEEGTLAQLAASRNATVAEYGADAFQSDYRPAALP